MKVLISILIVISMFVGSPTPVQAKDGEKAAAIFGAILQGIENGREQRHRERRWREDRYRERRWREDRCRPDREPPPWEGGHHRPWRRPDYDRGPDDSQNYNVFVKNNSSRTIDVAVCYNDGRDWKVQGWWVFSPGEYAKLGRLSNNPNIYFYAQSSDGTTWTGDNNTTVNSGEFFITDGEGERTVAFSKAYVTPGSDRFTYTFNE
jgi:hypothetical protein